MLYKVIAKLKTGKYPRVVAYGVEQLPEPPYVVVKPERDPVGRGRVFRIIAHFMPGQHIFLENYVRNDLDELLSDFMTTTRYGNHNTLLIENDYTDIIVDNDDKTISMERVFLMPSMIF